MTSMKPGTTYLISHNKGMTSLNMNLNVACTAVAILMQHAKHTLLLCSTKLPTPRAAQSAEATDFVEQNPR